jgi:hypothetical protein
MKNLEIKVSQNVITLPRNITIENPFPLRLRTKGIDWEDKTLAISAEYFICDAVTQDGTGFQCLKYKSKEISILENHSDNILKEHNIDINSLKIDATTNCYGFCFLDSNYWLNDPSIFINEYLEQVEVKENPNFLILYAHIDNDRFANPIYEPCHAIKLNKDATCDYKNGFHAIVKNDTIENALSEYNFNHKSYYRLK